MQIEYDAPCGASTVAGYIYANLGKSIINSSSFFPSPLEKPVPSVSFDVNVRAERPYRSCGRNVNVSPRKRVNASNDELEMTEDGEGMDENGKMRRY